jgi:photosystem II stability/assembly factor-like uncharacterized protein
MKRAMSMLIMAAVLSGAAVGGESWKQPLAEKEKAIEANIRDRHNILGLYPSQVEVPLDGSPADNTTLGIGNIAHSVCWTANYLAGCSFRYAYLRKSGAPAAALADAKARADEVFEAVYRCQLVTGVPGLQARGYALGHGESYEERWDDATRNEWHQGEGEYRDLRWRGDPSHHNYSDSVHGLMQYWRLAAEGEQKKRAMQAIDSLVSYWVDNDYKIHKLDQDRPPTPILGWFGDEVLNTRILMAVAGAKYAHYVTGKEKFKAAYEDLIARTGMRGMKNFAYEKGFDDGEHCFCHLENLLNIEEDPELRAAYRLILDTMWEAHRNDGQSLFTYIYAGLTPDAENMDGPMKQAHEALRTWPADTTLKPRMNSLYPNRKPPYPVYQAAWDNEYIWKGNLLRADGWLSRIVTDLAVPAEDPMVIYAVEENGSVYQSRDGAATPGGWRVIDGKLPSPARAIAAGPRVRMLFAACNNGFYRSMTGGYAWEKLPVPDDGGRPVNIALKPDGTHTLYATTTRGAYVSPDYGEEFMGLGWECLTEGLPAAKEARYHVASAKHGRVYAILDSITFSRRFDETGWQRGGMAGLPEYIDNYPWFVADPSDPDHAFIGMHGNIPGFGVKSLLQETTDGGMTWSNDMDSIYQQFHTAGLVKMLSLLLGGELCRPVVDPENPDILYAGKKGGIIKSVNGGESWTQGGSGFAIPWVQSIFAPVHSDAMFAGTPAGLYVSQDKGATWEDAHLWLQFQKNTRREIGGAAYIDAFWRARYYGLITDEMAVAPAE